MTDREQRTCHYCHEPIAGRPWVVLNRAVFGSGKAWLSSEFLNEDDVCEWEPEENVVSGPALCFPHCLTTLIEGKMLEAEICTGETG